MRLILFIALFACPYLLSAQFLYEEAAIKTTVNISTKKKAVKPWMYYYLYPNRNRIIPFQNPYPNSFNVPTGSYRNIASRNKLHNERLSGYLNKVYQSQTHQQTVNDLRRFSDQTMSYNVPQNFINRAVSNLIMQIK
ncbi:MAG: hypothetical protein AAF985_18960 [Bacteroidota bacterium]